MYLKDVMYQQAVEGTAAESSGACCCLGQSVLLQVCCTSRQYQEGTAAELSGACGVPLLPLSSSASGAHMARWFCWGWSL